MPKELVFNRRIKRIHCLCNVIAQNNRIHNVKFIYIYIYISFHLNWIFLNGNKSLDVSSCLTQDKVR